jgi:glyoxylase-like metal-dependent hydrolase (beta-lactamase superfamily II)
MAMQIDANTLRTWLDRGDPVTVVDIRSDEDRRQWSIPGSVHINEYDAVKNGDPGALANAVFTTDAPVVTICNMGKISQRAAEILAARGFNAVSLAGGMKAWSLAWNTAEVPVSNSNVRIVQVRRTGKGCLSYLIGSGNEAAVLDAVLPSSVYIDIAAQHGWRIRTVLETHVHADHLSRSRALANETKAHLLVPAQQRLRFPFEPVNDGNEITFGAARLKAIRTPGHTEESTCYLLQEATIFTGDTLFLDGFGRPDLHASPDEARCRAALLYASLHRLFALNSNVLVLPGHSSAPTAFDGAPIVSSLGDVSRRLGSWLASEEEFIARILQRIPPIPPNFSRILELNESGLLPEGDPTDLEAGANRCAVS